MKDVRSVRFWEACVDIFCGPDLCCGYCLWAVWYEILCFVSSVKLLELLVDLCLINNMSRCVYSAGFNCCRCGITSFDGILVSFRYKTLCFQIDNTHSVIGVKCETGLINPHDSWQHDYYFSFSTYGRSPEISKVLYVMFIFSCLELVPFDRL